MGVKISNLPAIVTPAASDVIPVVQAGVTYKETMTQLGTLFANSGINTNITSMTGLTGVLQAPTFINDSSGNEVLGFESVSSAVNYISIINNDTTNPPAFESKGSDTNVGMTFVAQEAGVFSFNTTESTNAFRFATGTAYQHLTQLTFANTSATRLVTFPDASGTLRLISKANGTEAANAVTASGTAGVITTSALTTAGGATYVITWTNTFITTSSIISLSIMGGTNTTQNITLTATAGAGTSTLTIYNNTAATALNGTIFIGYSVIP
jgi:hypothetical protein